MAAWIMRIFRPGALRFCKQCVSCALGGFVDMTGGTPTLVNDGSSQPDSLFV
jgi:hypothetical protein